MTTSTRADAQSVNAQTADAQLEASRMTTSDALMTAEELFAYTLPNKRVELVRGRLIVREPPGMRHGEQSARIVIAIGGYLSNDRATRGAAQPRGRVITCDPGFTLARNPDTVRAPDVAYVSQERMGGPTPIAYGEFAPDLAVEIRSPTDRAGPVLAKVSDWLTAGSQLVWVIDQGRQLVTVYRADGSQARLDVHDALDGETVLPGFSYSLDALFAD